MKIFLLLPLIILIALEFKHFIFDFVWQSDYIKQNKYHYMHPAGQVHALKHAIGTAVVFLFGAAMFEEHWKHAAIIIEAVFFIDWITHYHIDFIKEKLIHSLNLKPLDHWYCIIFGADQMLHRLNYIALVYFFT